MPVHCIPSCSPKERHKATGEDGSGEKGCSEPAQGCLGSHLPTAVENEVHWSTMSRAPLKVATFLGTELFGNKPQEMGTLCKVTGPEQNWSARRCPRRELLTKTALWRPPGCKPTASPRWQLSLDTRDHQAQTKMSASSLLYQRFRAGAAMRPDILHDAAAPKPAPAGPGPLGSSTFSLLIGYPPSRLLSHAGSNNQTEKDKHGMLSLTQCTWDVKEWNSHKQGG